MALLAGELVPEVAVFGSITLDNEVGGLNPAAVLAAARMGAKVVWMPTVTSANSKAKAEQAFKVDLSGPPRSILSSGGTLIPEVKEIVEIVKKYDIALATGHLSPREVFVLFDAAKASGLSKIIVTHALQGDIMEAILTNEELKQLSQAGAFIEYSFWACMPTVSSAGPQRIAESIRVVGAQHCILTSDFGQYYNPPAPEGLRLFIATMLKEGLAEDEIEVMIKKNPAQLLGLS